MTNFIISIHALLAESDFYNGIALIPHQKFLSTLSLRRATYIIGHTVNLHPISIHALLAESDVLVVPSGCWLPISIHALLAESDGVLFLIDEIQLISIHALLAESDLRTLT